MREQEKIGSEWSISAGGGSLGGGGRLGGKGESVNEGEARLGHTQASRLPRGELRIRCKNCI